MIPQALWEKLVEFAAAGGNVVFVGPPPSCTTVGEDLARSFADLVGIESVPLTDYLSLVKERFPGSADASGILDIILYQRPPRIDFFYPVKPRQATQLADTEGDPWATRAEDRSVWWLTGLDPQEKLSELVTPLEAPGLMTADLRDAYWRTYESTAAVSEPRVGFLLAMARSRRTLEGTIVCEGGRVLVRGTGMVVLRIEGGRPVAALGEDLDLLELDGIPFPWKPIEPGPRVERKRWSLPKKPLATTLNRDCVLEERAEREAR
jgi:hypothetical protein